MPITNIAAAWFRIFKMLIHTTHCKPSDPTSCRVHSTPAFATAMYAHFTPLYIPIFNKLDVHIGKEASKAMMSSEPLDSPSSSDAQDKNKGKEKAGLWQATLTWRALGASLGINEEVERGARNKGDASTSKPGEAKRVCWWAKCENDTKAEEEGKSYMRCSGCKAVTCV